MIIEEEPAEQSGENQHQRGQRIAVFPHVGVKRAIGTAPVGFAASTIDAIGVVMPFAANIAVADAAVHEQTVLALGRGHGHG